jgi:hypothetical protein
LLQALLPEADLDTTVNLDREMNMVRDSGRIQLWAELGFADLLSPVAVGASFEGLADFLISGITDTHAASGSVAQSDCIRDAE